MKGKPWKRHEIRKALQDRQVEGRTHAAVVSKLNSLGIRTKPRWTPDEILVVMRGGFPEGHTKNAIYQLRHKLGKGVCDPINKYIDPKNPDQTALDLPPGKKPSLNKHHHESVGELLLPIYTMYNGGMKPLDIAKSINQSVELVQAAIAMKELYKPAT